ncbi:hypothetical protein EDEG_00304 [Edhazardia aedis USNM 41457]|uniref:Calponin-homology (CH) domain-containing protein n=1 Tax=Edhazardia aedis (strain USNM 41457) TaxID=1003232 RepID=J8ZRA9_EDHAE|nr:hypothetical protein EDEG_00304 [Edhazardia aedis USNM 41457]|eukprot:EJW02233.1 hypothetical protein EDEG_00304 [Edhazardia aedis USNM 41457]
MSTNISRRALLQWIFDLTHHTITKIETIGEGQHICLVLSILDTSFPKGSIILNPTTEAQFLKNLRLAKSYLDSKDVITYFPVDKMSKCKVQDNLEFMQWFYGFCQQKINSAGIVNENNCEIFEPKNNLNNNEQSSKNNLNVDSTQKNNLNCTIESKNRNSLLRKSSEFHAGKRSFDIGNLSIQQNNTSKTNHEAQRPIKNPKINIQTKENNVSNNTDNLNINSKKNGSSFLGPKRSKDEINHGKNEQLNNSKAKGIHKIKTSNIKTDAFNSTKNRGYSNPRLENAEGLQDHINQQVIQSNKNSNRLNPQKQTNTTLLKQEKKSSLSFFKENFSDDEDSDFDVEMYNGNKINNKSSNIYMHKNENGFKSLQENHNNNHLNIKSKIDKQNTSKLSSISSSLGKNNSFTNTISNKIPQNKNLFANKSWESSKGSVLIQNRDQKTFDERSEKAIKTNSSFSDISSKKTYKNSVENTNIPQNTQILNNIDVSKITKQVSERCDECTILKNMIYTLQLNSKQLEITISDLKQQIKNLEDEKIINKNANTHNQETITSLQHQLDDVMKSCDEKLEIQEKEFGKCVVEMMDEMELWKNDSLFYYNLLKEARDFIVSTVLDENLKAKILSIFYKTNTDKIKDSE